MDIQSLLAQHLPDLIAKLTQQTDLNEAQAQRFIPEAAQQTASALGSGGLDIQSLLGGQLGGLLSKFDIGALATKSGVAEDQASSALESFLPQLIGILQGQAGGLEGVVAAFLGQGGGAAGVLGKLTKMFGR